ncbi:MAG: NAD-dependent epimerase/dehydratase family protein [Terriglobia bacterium]|jgi:UDP-glucose 4-epimerase
MKLRLAITGSSGYLAQQLMARFGADPDCEFILGMDIRRREFALPCAAELLRFDLTAPWELLAEFWTKRRINAGLHLAWQFNPLHDRRRQREVDVQGSLNFLRAAAAAGLKRMVYCGSTTAYVNPRNPGEEPWLGEETKPTGTPRYLYSYHKAEIDRVVQDFQEQHPEMQVTLLRGAIVLGPHTQNIVAKMLDWPWRRFPWMFQVRGSDPPFQFLSEEDMGAILIRALKAEAGGIFNCAGDGTMPYSEVVRGSGKHPWALPAAILYPLTNLLWKLRLSPFPAGILDLIRYPWVADTARLKTVLGYTPQHTSRQALQAFLAARRAR